MFTAIFFFNLNMRLEFHNRLQSLAEIIVLGCVILWPQRVQMKTLKPNYVLSPSNLLGWRLYEIGHHEYRGPVNGLYVVW